MKCHVCGSNFTPKTMDIPFVTGETSIVIMKGVPVLQCENCGEYVLEDHVMKRVEQILSEAGSSAEVEIIRYAA